MTLEKGNPLGKTSKPLTILIDPSIADWKEWQDLRDKGHTIALLFPNDTYDPRQADLVMGPRMWRMNDHTRKYLDLAIEWSRQEKYPSGTPTPTAPTRGKTPSTPVLSSEPTGQ